MTMATLPPPYLLFPPSPLLSDLLPLFPLLFSPSPLRISLLPSNHEIFSDCLSSSEGFISSSISHRILDRCSLLRSSNRDQLNRFSNRIDHFRSNTKGISIPTKRFSNRNVYFQKYYTSYVVVQPPTVVFQAESKSVMTEATRNCSGLLSDRLSSRASLQVSTKGIISFFSKFFSTLDDSTRDFHPAKDSKNPKGAFQILLFSPASNFLGMAAASNSNMVEPQSEAIISSSGLMTQPQSFSGIRLGSYAPSSLQQLQSDHPNSAIGVSDHLDSHVLSVVQPHPSGCPLQGSSA